MGGRPVLNIGKLAPGGEGYYLSTVASGVEDYYTGSGEAPGYWSGSAAGAFGLSGEVAADDLHALLAGVDPVTGERLVDPVRRAHPRSLLATGPLRAALGAVAGERGVDVARLSGSDSKARRWLAESGRSETMAVERVERVAAAAGVDLAAVYDAQELEEARGHRGRRVDVRVPAFDCTFRAPKSVSLLFGLGDAATAQRVRVAHDRAVEQAVGYLEREAGTVRRGRNGVDRQEGSGFAVAAFRHRSSRARDPLLHTHALVANLVQGEDGKWGAVASAGLYTHAKTAGALYQAALRDELTAALGVEWGPVRNGCADVAGVPEGVIRAFSQRRAAIEAEMARRGVSGARAAQVATLATRAAKPGPDEAATEPMMRDEWQARGRELGFGRDEVAALLGRGREPHPPVPLADVADRLLGEEGLTARASSFTRRDAVQAWCAALPAGAPVGEVERLADALLGGDADGRVVPLLPTPAALAGGRDDVEQLVAAVSAAVPDGADRLVTSLPLRDALAAALDGGMVDADLLTTVIGDDLVGAKDRVAVVIARAQRAAERAPGAARLDRRAVLRRSDGRVVATVPGERRYSTTDLLAVEQQLVEGAVARTAASVGVATEDAVAAALARRPSIGADQAAMVERITRSGAGVEVVVGPAGTGKTFALDAARAAWEASRVRVIGAALSAQARNELEAGAGVDGYTLAALLGQLDDAATRGGRRGVPLDARTVVILDEAGMVGSRQMARLLAHAAAHDAKVVLVGDDRQLPEIDAGGAFRALTRRLHPVELTENRRQHDPVQAAALGELRAGDPVAGVAAFTDAGLIWVGQTAEDVRERLVSDWWAARDEGHAGVMLAGRNADIDDLNARARARRVASGELIGAEVDAAGAPLQVGDEVVATANQHVRATDGASGRVQLANGARGVVTAVHPATGSVDAQVRLGGAERTVRVGPRLLAAGQLRHGYAVTCHKAQGLTTEEVFVLGSDQLYREWLYTALSRARHANRLYLVAAPAVGDVEVAKVSHHGSATSSAQAWVDTLSAEVAVLTVGDNGFGHPDPAVVQRWDADGEVFQTGGADGGLVDGNVTVTTDGASSASVTGAASGRGTAVSLDGAGGASGEPPPAPGSAPVFDGNPATTERVAAADPAAAALAISRARFGDGSARRVVLSRDDDFADSLAGSVLTDTGPLLYTATDALPAATADEIGRVLPGGGTVYLLGGDTVIGAGVESGLAADGYDVRRLAGGSRVETAVAVGDEVRTVRGATPRVAVARGYGPADNPTVAWADSVTGGGWAADSASPVLVTGADQVHSAVVGALARWAPEQTVLLGGTTALPSGFEAQVPNPARVSGADRAGTAAAVAAQLWEPTAPRRYVVVDGYRTDGWAYALAAAGLAADTNAPLLLSSGDNVPGDTLTAASTPCGQGPTVDVVVVGDTTVVPDSVVAALDSVDGAPCPAEEPPPPPPSEPPPPPPPPPPAPEPEPEPAPNCDPAYPDFCLPPPPPDLDCGSAVIGGRKDFTALPPDPHGLDGDGNGVACQSPS